MEVEHLLLALLSDDEGIVWKSSRNWEQTSIGFAMRPFSCRAASRQSGTATADRYFSNQLRAVLEAAFKEMEQLKDEYVSVEHLLIALARPGNRSREDSEKPRRNQGQNIHGSYRNPRHPESDRPVAGREIPGAETIYPAI